MWFRFRCWVKNWKGRHKRVSQAEGPHPTLPAPWGLWLTSVWSATMYNSKNFGLLPTSRLSWGETMVTFSDRLPGLSPDR